MTRRMLLRTLVQRLIFAVVLVARAQPGHEPLRWASRHDPRDV